MSRILSGEKIARQILSNLQKKKPRRKLSLAVLQVGENVVSARYVGEKRKVAKELRVGFRYIRLPADISQVKLEREIERVGKDKEISGMIVQLPLPRQLNTQRALDLIPKRKDVDVLSSVSFSDFALGILSILPPTVAAISLLLKESKRKLEGANVVVVGAGRLVGLPTALWLAQEGAALSLIQKDTRNASQLISKADIVISGVGKPKLITGKMIKKGAVVIDAGTSVGEHVRHSVSNTLKTSKIEGDVEFESVVKKAGYLAPVPGGVGPLTVACLFKNLFLLNG
ncbi:MAG: bifunctional 5,10-methylenetetrahydrofolate dehydrogenase/5,10-methenyltetrahydrofolate cyclohydrolase [bacterium]|nr:bifunctional 5,10-methylenetetrahydrofolate dehydrogenase/5,10-methenyltetrahydrofolate cyclohydrolase [bacterium]